MTDNQAQRLAGSLLGVKQSAIHGEQNTQQAERHRNARNRKETPTLVAQRVFESERQITKHLLLSFSFWLE